MSIAYNENQSSDWLYVASSSLSVAQAVDPRRAHIVRHSKRDASGNAVTSVLWVTNAQYEADAGAIPPTDVEGRNKFPIQPGEQELIPAGHSALTFTNANDVMVVIIPTANVGPNL